MSDAVRTLSDAMAADGALKLWSVLVTCLGDLSREDAVEVSGTTLSALVERIGLQPQAMRVALHRLKRDGWIESRREGRVGYHRLTENALQQSRAVGARVYGPAVTEGRVRLVGLPEDQPDAMALLPEEASGVLISRRFALVTGETDIWPDEWLVARLEPGAFPDWVRTALQQAACETEFADFARVLPVEAVPLDPLDRLALRVLVLHGWRRLILRSNAAAEIALGANRSEIRCRAIVLAMLDRLSVDAARQEAS